MLADAGIEADVVVVNFDKYNEQIAAKQYDSFLGDTNISQNMDLSFLLSSKVAGGNFANYESPQMDIILDEIKNGSIDSEKPLYEKLINQYNADLPYVSLYFKNNALLYHNSIKGIEMPPQDNTYGDICDWFINSNK